MLLKLQKKNFIFEGENKTIENKSSIKQPVHENKKKLKKKKTMDKKQQHD